LSCLRIVYLSSSGSVLCGNGGLPSMIPHIAYAPPDDAVHTCTPSIFIRPLLSSVFNRHKRRHCRRNGCEGSCPSVLIVMCSCSLASNFAVPFFLCGWLGSSSRYTPLYALIRWKWGYAHPLVQHVIMPLVASNHRIHGTHAEFVARISARAAIISLHLPP